MYTETVTTGVKMKVRVANVTCTEGKGRSSLWFRNDNNEVKHVNIPLSDCKNFKVGDSITIFVNKDNDWYEIDPAMLKAEQRNN